MSHSQRHEPVIAPDVSARRISDLFSLRGRTAVVTGGGRGIGKAIAHRLAEAGAAVVIGDVDGEAASASAEDLRTRHGGSAWGETVDVADVPSVRALVDYTDEVTEGVDIWVNAAGIYPLRPILDIDDAHWIRVLDINLRGTMIGSREAARNMVANGRGGVIVNVASVTSFRAGPGGAAYVASKHGVAGLTKSLALELGPSGIRALAVAPATVLTEGLRQLESEFADIAGGDMAQRSIDRVRLGRLAVPDDVARVVLFCATDMAMYMTGATVPVDGGDLVS